MERRLEIERLIGNWHYDSPDGEGGFSDCFFTIYENENKLWFHEYNLDDEDHGRNDHGQMKKMSDYFVVQEDWGSRLFRPRGHIILFCCGEADEKVYPHHATRLAYRK